MKLRSISYFLLTLGILTLGGLLGYYFGFLGFIYNVMIPEALGNFPLVALAVIFGVAAFFSPCSLTVLPSYISHYLTGDTSDILADKKQESRILKGLYLGLVAGAGIVTINIILGLIIALLGGATPFAKDPRQDIPLILGIRIVAGFLIAYFGVLTFLDKPFDIPFVNKVIGQINFRKSIFLYGLLYNAAAVGCTGPILLGLMLYAFTTGSFTSALTAFIIFALTMAFLMVIMTSSIALFKNSLVKTILPLMPKIKKIAGMIMVVTGVTIALLTLEGNNIFVKLFFPYLK